MSRHTQGYYQSNRDHNEYSDYNDNSDYRADEELYVYDQHCGNCALNYPGLCPMDFDENEKDICKKEANEKRLREDVVRRDGAVEWCVNWQQHIRLGCRHR